MSDFNNTPPDAVALTDVTFDNTAPGATSIAGNTFDNVAPVPVSTATSTTVYYGRSSQAVPTEAQIKSDLLTTTKTTVAGNYVCGATGYKFLAVPANFAPPSTIRDMSTGFAVALAGSADGYTQTANSLPHLSVTVDGVSFRLYRSANTMGAELTLQVA